MALTNKLTAIGGAIRSKTSDNATMTLSQTSDMVITVE